MTRLARRWSAPAASRVALLRAATTYTTQLGQARPRGHVNLKSTI